MAPRAHQYHRRLTRPSAGPPRGQRDSENTGRMPAWIIQHPAKQDVKGATASTRIISCRWSARTTQVKRDGTTEVKTDCPHHQQTKGRGNRPISYCTHAVGTSQGSITMCKFIRRQESLRIKHTGESNGN